MADYRRQIGFIKKWEAGLSNDPNDTASFYPMPCQYQGQYGWHTNKGITWQTFSSLADPLGYAGSCANFIQMPDSIWLKIYKKSFWDKFLLDQYHSQAIADIVVAWAWGSGLGGAYRQLAKFLNANYGANLPDEKKDFSSQNVSRIKELFNSITRRNKREANVQEELIQHFRNFYISLNRPYYINGWLNRLEELDEFTKQSIPGSKNNLAKAMIAGLGLLALVSGIAYLLDEQEQTKSA